MRKNKNKNKNKNKRERDRANLRRKQETVKKKDAPHGGFSLRFHILVRLRYALTLCRASAQHKLKLGRVADIAACASSHISKHRLRKILLSSLLPLVFLFSFLLSLVIRNLRESENIYTVSPEHRRNALSTSTSRHYWYCHAVLSFIVVADNCADWDNIGFKVREGMCEHSVFVLALGLQVMQSMAI